MVVLNLSLSDLLKEHLKPMLDAPEEAFMSASADDIKASARKKLLDAENQTGIRKQEKPVPAVSYLPL